MNRREPVEGAARHGARQTKADGTHHLVKVRSLVRISPSAVFLQLRWSFSTLTGADRLPISRRRMAFAIAVF